MKHNAISDQRALLSTLARLERVVVQEQGRRLSVDAKENFVLRHHSKPELRRISVAT